MYLARVEMTGFKSFADKTIIEFDRGMTAVVGPNGSGKSNLSEAIRWVLGEQSAKSLRGNKMEDVIFNGSQGRKAVNVAKVTLILNNEDRYLDLDFSEISLTRSYHRSGESQYFINNEPCRLKDIVDLLLDSGLGKNSFSIISQGQVEQIFLNKAEERRLIFEEAAGVQKYQFRKQEAERKLIKSQDHLSRVRDIIYELERQLEPLAEQKEKALTYQAYKQELEKHEIALYTQQIQTSKANWDQEAQALATLSKEIDDSEQALRSGQDQLQSKKQSLQALTNHLDQQTEAYQAVIQGFERLQGQKNMLSQELSFRKSKQVDQGQQLDQSQEKLATLKQEQTALRDEKSQLDQRQRDLLAQIKSLTTHKERLSLSSERQLDQVRDVMIEAYQNKAAANNQVRVFQEQEQSLTWRIQQLQGHLAERQGQKASMIDKLNQVEQDLMERQIQQQQEQDRLKHEIQALENLQAKDQQIRQQIFDQERQMNQAKNRWEGLKQAQEEYVGYYAGVRTLMKEQLPGIHGPVAELIRVEEGYQTAIEIALGGAWQHLVVDSDQVARQAIDLLKQRRAGRATFLPIPNIKPRRMNGLDQERAQSAPGYLGLASEFVHYQTNYQSIIENLLGTVLVVKTLKQAQDLAKNLNHRAKIVTLEGDLLLPGGSLTGGKHKNNQQSLLQRQDDLELAKQAYQNSYQSLKATEALMAQVTEQVKTKQALLRQAQEQGQDSDKQVEALRYQLKQLQEEAKQWQENLVLDQDKLKEYRQDLLKLKENYQASQALLDQAEKDIQTYQAQMDQANLSEEEKQKELQTLDQALNQAQTDLAVVKVELEQAKLQDARLSQEITELQNLVDHYQAQKSQGQSSQEELEERLRQLEVKDREISQQQATMSASLTKLKARRQEEQVLISQLEDQVNQLQQQLQGHYQKQARYQAQVEKHQSFIDNYLTYLNQEYQLSFEAALERAQSMELADVSNDSVRKLKQKIERLGPVNLQAIEDFEEQNTRYQALVYQENDLLKAMDQLQTTMDEMDQEVIQRFAYTFEQINQQFQRTFRALFAGGQASLELTNPSDLLTTGVDILAQPPGKKKQNLALLSGGERALTAIALLFAILETRPVPFVVLDEVEAALDDANVYRYGEYIQNFTKQTQFIVITHRKGTMEHADVLYGVTMQQSGISKLASVKLSDRQMEEDSV